MANHTNTIIFTGDLAIRHNIGTNHLNTMMNSTLSNWTNETVSEEIVNESINNIKELGVKIKDMTNNLENDESNEYYNIDQMTLKLNGNLDNALENNYYSPEQYFNLTMGFTCNNNCLHCFVKHLIQPFPDLTTNQVKSIIDKVPEGFIIGFTGGEATIRKDLIELLKYSKDTGHKQALQTNGALLHKEEYAREVASYLDDLVLLSIHSHIPEIHNKIVHDKTGTMHAKTIKGFKNLLKNGVSIKTQTVISSLNIKYLLETFDFIQSISPNIKMNLKYSYSLPNKEAEKDVYVTLTDIRKYLLPAFKKWGHLLQVEAIPICCLYPYQDKINNYDKQFIIGDHFPAYRFDPYEDNVNNWDMTNLTQQNITEFLETRTKVEACSTCDFNDECGGFYKDYLLFHKENIDVIPLKK